MNREPVIVPTGMIVVLFWLFSIAITLLYPSKWAIMAWVFTFYLIIEFYQDR